MAATEADEKHPKAYKRAIDIGIECAEDAVYVVVALLLFGVAALAVYEAITRLSHLRTQSVADVALDVLDLLLLVFIVVELLYAVRTTVKRRELLAEPFLIVGIIASIKEIVVLSVKAADEAGSGQVFHDHLYQIGVLGLVVLALAAAALMMRRKEREPEEST